MNFEEAFHTLSRLSGGRMINKGWLHPKEGFSFCRKKKGLYRCITHINGDTNNSYVPIDGIKKLLPDGWEIDLDAGKLYRFSEALEHLARRFEKRRNRLYRLERATLVEVFGDEEDVQVTRDNVGFMEHRRMGLFTIIYDEKVVNPDKVEGVDHED